MVEGEGVFKPISRETAGVPETPDVVDQDVDARECLEDLAGQPANLGLRGQVGDEHLHVPGA